MCRWKRREGRQALLFGFKFLMSVLLFLVRGLPLSRLPLSRPYSRLSHVKKITLTHIYSIHPPPNP